MPENTTNFFDSTAVRVVKLPDWMAWASGTSESPYKVVLPMIQRGSVWAPHKLLDLWDTLLRGMPVGALMASTAVGNTVKVLDQAGTRGASSSDIGLIDGQQRTLAMMAGWPQGLQNPLRLVAIWVDLAEAPQGEYLFRLWVTTRAQPFGYARVSMGGQPLGKLTREHLRQANHAWEKMEAQKLWCQPDFMPWAAKFALPLTELMEQQRKGALPSFVAQRLASYKAALAEKCKMAANLEVADKNASDEETTAKTRLQTLVAGHFRSKLEALPTLAELATSVAAIQNALEKVLASEFPVIHVRQESFEDKASSEGNASPEVNADPALAIFFKRVGAGGEPLSNADYVYAVIKHHAPQVHDMVDQLLKDEKIRAIYTPTTLVMSAVRMTMLSLKNTDGKGPKVADSARLDKAAFARIVRNHHDFIGQFTDDIRPGGIFTTRLQQVLDGMSYSHSPEFRTGLPKHALCLVPVALLETILAWHTLHAPQADAAALASSALPMVRFVLQGRLCVMDYAKASELAIKVMKEDKAEPSDIFPDQVLMAALCKSEVAVPLPSPAQLSAIVVRPMACVAATQPDPYWHLHETPDNGSGLRGWTRFDVVNETDKPSAELYKRWWMGSGGHVHPLLLWLQSDYVFARFEAKPALAGLDEETPYDFDHLLPSAQWADWTGSKKGVGERLDRFIDFPLRDAANRDVDSSGHWHVGNSIGNIHVLDSSDNRSWGDTSIEFKLDAPDFANHALIGSESVADWKTASGDKDKPRQWALERAQAFQKAVEQRVFAMYEQFYKDLHPPQ